MTKMAHPESVMPEAAEPESVKPEAAEPDSDPPQGDQLSSSQGLKFRQEIVLPSFFLTELFKELAKIVESRPDQSLSQQLSSFQDLNIRNDVLSEDELRELGKDLSSLIPRNATHMDYPEQL